MKFFKLKYVDPIGKQSFRLHILTSILFQIAFILSVFLGFYFFRLKIPAITEYWFSLLFLCINSLFFFLAYDFNKYRARFKDIYPDYNLSLQFFVLTAFFPLAFIMLTAFLCIKEGHDPKPPTRVFKIRFAVPALVVLMVLQIASTQFSYWTASPSMYYIVDVGHDTLNIIRYKETAIYRNDQIEIYRNRYPGKLNSTQIILMVAVDAAIIIKEKNRTIASIDNKQDAEFNYGLQLLETLHKMIVIGETDRMDAFDFSPLHWLYPTGPTEIFLLTMVEQQIITKFNSTIFLKSSEVLDGMEKKLVSMKSSRKAYFPKEIFELRKKFQQTKTSIQNRS